MANKEVSFTIRAKDAASAALKQVGNAASGVTAKFFSLKAVLGVATGAFAAFSLGTIVSDLIDLGAASDGVGRKLAAMLPTASAGIAQLKQEISDLAVTSGRSLQEMQQAAVQIAHLGVSSAAEVSARLAAATELSDATGANLTEVVDGLDQLMDAFNLNANQAEGVLASLVSAAKGRVDIESLFEAFQKATPIFQKFNIDVDTGTKALVALLDSGRNARQIGQILNTATADGIRFLASQATISASALDDLRKSADGVRDGADRAAARIKADFSESLTALSETILPKVIAGMQGLLALMGVYDTQIHKSTLGSITALAGRVSAGQTQDIGELKAQLSDVLNLARSNDAGLMSVVPDKILDKLSPADLQAAITGLRALHDQTKLSADEFDTASKNIGAMQGRLAQLKQAPASSASATASTGSKPLVIPESAEEIKAAEEAAKKLRDLQLALASLLATSDAGKSKAEQFAESIAKWAEQAKTAKLPTADLQAALSQLTAAWGAIAQGEDTKAADDAFDQLGAAMAKFTGGPLAQLDEEASTTFAKLAEQRQNLSNVGDLESWDAAVAHLADQYAGLRTAINTVSNSDALVQAADDAARNATSAEQVSDLISVLLQNEQDLKDKADAALDPATAEKYASEVDKIKQEVEKLYGVWSDVGGAVDASTNRVADLATAFTDVARAIVGAAEAFGAMDRKTAATLQDVAGLAEALGQISKGNKIAGVTAGVTSGIALTGEIGAGSSSKLGAAVGGSASGAAEGALIGTMIAPGIGTAVGAIVGSLGGLVSGLLGQSAALKKARKEFSDAQSQFVDSLQVFPSQTAQQFASIEKSFHDLEDAAKAARTSVSADAVAAKNAAEAALTANFLGDLTTQINALSGASGDIANSLATIDQAYTSNIRTAKTLGLGEDAITQIEALRTAQLQQLADANAAAARAEADALNDLDARGFDALGQSTVAADLRRKQAEADEIAAIENDKSLGDAARGAKLQTTEYIQALEDEATAKARATEAANNAAQINADQSGREATLAGNPNLAAQIALAEQQREALQKLVSESGVTAETIAREMKDQAAEMAALIKSQQENDATTAIQTLTTKVSDAMSDQLSVAKDQLSAAQTAAQTAETTLSATQAAYQSLLKFQQSIQIGTLSTLSPIAQAATAKQQLQDLFTAAKSGDKDAAGQFDQAANTFLQASQAVNASGPQYAADFATVQQMAAALVDQYGAQQTTDQAALDAATQQVDLLQQQVDAIQSEIDTIAKVGQNITEAVGSASDAQIAAIANVIASLGDAQALAHASTVAQLAALNGLAAVLGLSGTNDAGDGGGTGAGGGSGGGGGTTTTPVDPMEQVYADLAAGKTLTADEQALVERNAINQGNQQLAGDQDARVLQVEGTIFAGATAGGTSQDEFDAYMANTGGYLAANVKQLSTTYGLDSAHKAQLAAYYQIPAFAAGGMHTGGWMTAGEMGAELISSGPARVFNAKDTADIFAGANAGGSAVVAQLNQVVAAQAATISVLQEGMSRLIEGNEALGAKIDANAKSTSRQLERITLPVGRGIGR